MRDGTELKKLADYRVGLRPIIVTTETVFTVFTVFTETVFTVFTLSNIDCTARNALLMIQPLLVKDSHWIMENYNVLAIIIMLCDFVKIIATKRFNAKESRRIIMWDIMACVKPSLKGMITESAHILCLHEMNDNAYGQICLSIRNN